MAFNVQTFKTRSLTALFFVVIMMVGLLINQWTFFILFSIIHFGCWFEYQKIIGLINKDYLQITSFHKYGVMLTGFGFMLWMLDDSYRIFNFRLHEVGWWFLIMGILVLPIAEILLSKKISSKPILYSVLGLLYISLSWGLLMDVAFIGNNKINSVEHTWRSYFMMLPIFIIVCMWVNDTMAYIVGSFIGKTPFSTISPKKTWEGTIGGIILCALVMGYLFFWLTLHNTLGYNKPLWFWITAAAIAAIIGTVGDLLESKLKRLANIKDSGTFMPGHGGFLDRFDSLLLATPFVWLFFKLFL